MVLGIDPGIAVTGYGLVRLEGRDHTSLGFGAIRTKARAMALLAAAQAELPVSLYKPLEVKQFVTSYGQGSKEQVQEMVRALLELDEAPQPTDAADALAVAICHCLKRQARLAGVLP